MNQARTTVPGEDLPVLVAAALAAIGIASAGGSALAFTTVSAPAPLHGIEERAPAPPIVIAPPPAPVVASAATEVTTTPSIASAPVGAGSSCPALVVELKSGVTAPPAGATAPLATLASWLVSHPAVTVVVDGHADAIGSEDENLRLSRDRAVVVGEMLARGGVARTRITTRGFGSFWPAEQAPPDASWNRRVVVQTKGDACPRAAEEVIEP